MIRWDHMRDDALSDVIGGELRTLAAMPMGKARMLKRARLIGLATAAGYVFFEASGCRYHASQVGEAYLYQVPHTKRGFLKPFRGKLVRIACIGSGRHSTRHYMVGTASTDQIALLGTHDVRIGDRNHSPLVRIRTKQG